MFGRVQATVAHIAAKQLVKWVTTKTLNATLCIARVRNSLNILKMMSCSIQRAGQDPETCLPVHLIGTNKKKSVNPEFTVKYAGLWRLTRLEQCFSFCFQSPEPPSVNFSGLTQMITTLAYRHRSSLTQRSQSLYRKRIVKVHHASDASAPYYLRSTLNTWKHRSL